jgi:Inner membrane protein YgaP-like, transmembrane domain
MGAQPNVTGIARLLYVVGGAAAASWGLWSGNQGWTQWVWLTLGGTALVLGIIGYSPLHALFGTKDQRSG